MHLTSKMRVPVVRATAGMTAMLALSACGNMSGLDGSSEFSCKAPKGVHCEAVSANYHNRAGQPGTVAAQPAASGGDNAAARVAGAAPRGMEPAMLRTPVRVMRLWVKAWEDSDRDLVDQSYVYVRIDEGTWRMAHVQKAARDAFPSPRPPASAKPAETPSRIPAAGGGGEEQAAPGAAAQSVLPGFPQSIIPAR